MIPNYDERRLFYVFLICMLIACIYYATFFKI